MYTQNPSSLPFAKDVFLQKMHQHPIEKNHFYDFFSTATPAELLQAQSPFYYAVEGFLQVLCHLASLIKEPHIRAPIIYNLYEEHGQGQKKAFHTQTYMDYLRALGLGNEPPKEHVATQLWLNALLDTQDSRLLALELAAIELIYTRVCHHLCKNLERLQILDSQTHYSKHEVLDIDHGSELIDVFFALNQKHQSPISEEASLNFMTEAMERFLNYLNRLCPISSKQALRISQEPVAFFYSREDGNIEVNLLRQMRADIKNHSNADKYVEPFTPRVLMICSGGEHLFTIANAFSNFQIDLWDINPHQIDLARKKIEQNTLFEPSFEIGKFEQLFLILAQKIGPLDKTVYQAQFDTLLWGICEQVFDKTVLETVFTKEATRYTSEAFDKHFYQTIKKALAQYPQLEGNIKNVLGLDVFHQYRTLKETQKVNFILGRYEVALQTSAQYDLISLSNIGDWMNQEEFQHLLALARKRLKPHGVIVCRRLLGDYDLLTLLHKPKTHHDMTHFYSQTVSGQ